MKIKYLKLKNWLLISLMGALGLSACHSNKKVVEPDPEPDKPKPSQGDYRAVPMYGVPYNKYSENDLKKVKDEPQAQPREPQVTVYGVPTVDFAVKGRVINANGKPVEGVQVMLLNSDIDPQNIPTTPEWQQRLKSVSDTTDVQGTFELTTTDRPWEKMNVMVRDIDGKKNGTYESQLIEVEFGEAKPGNRPMNGWHQGTREAEITIKLENSGK